MNACWMVERCGYYQRNNSPIVLEPRTCEASNSEVVFAAEAEPREFDPLPLNSDWREDTS